MVILCVQIKYQPNSTAMNQIKQYSLSAKVLLIILFSASIVSCNSSEKAALLIGKKAKAQAAKLNFSKEICLKNTIEELETINYTPTISEIFTEKTELIPSW